MTIRLPGVGATQLRQSNPISRTLAFYVLLSTSSSILIPFRHSLLVTSLAWTMIYLHCVGKMYYGRRGEKVDISSAKDIAGLLFGIAAVCERASGDEACVGATVAFLPVVTRMFLNAIRTPSAEVLLSRTNGDPSKRKTTWFRSQTLNLAAVTATVFTAVTKSYATPQGTVLGVIAVVARAAAYALLEWRIEHPPNEKVERMGWGPRVEEGLPENYEFFGKVLDTGSRVSWTAAITTAAGSLYIESFPALGQWTSLTAKNGSLSMSSSLLLLGNLASPIVVAASIYFLLCLVHEKGAVSTAVASLGSLLGKHSWLEPSLWSAWLAVVYGASLTAVFATEGSLQLEPFTTVQNGSPAWWSTLVLVLAVASLLASLFPTSSIRYYKTTSQDMAHMNAPSVLGRPSQPLHLSKEMHPIKLLTKEAQASFEEKLSRQSRTLHDAVKEYRRRYGVHPPPKFDIWFQFAKAKGTVLVDEFDSLHENLLPFWSLGPNALRERASEAVGYDENGLMVMMIRNGKVTLLDGSKEWLRTALTEMVAGFVEHLPDMDIAFNIHDEPRVTIPHSELSRMTQFAETLAFPSALSHQEPRNSFSPPPADMTDGHSYKEYTITRFNKFSHQPTWSHARLSCPPDSPARDFTEQAADNLTAYALGELGFIYNQTAFSDICNSPSLRDTHGFFDRPNMFIPTQDLVPVFSQSKLSSFQDIVYPSPWYWADKVEYSEVEDMAWEEKNSSLYWRGSTTGGYSRRGGWRRHHRQRCVQQINARGETTVLEAVANSPDDAAQWTEKTVDRTGYDSKIDVRFAHVGQCDDGDCHAQREFFHVVEQEEQQSAWNFKYLLDMDGNAFSGRFLAFLKSRSMVAKMSIFREWHSDWVQPWLHYVPLSLRGKEWLETVRYLDEEQEGQTLAESMAEESRVWANRALRKEDMEVWFFRLLLEYGRLLDDDRDSIGYPGP